MPMREDKRDIGDEGSDEKEVPIETSTERVQIKRSKEVRADTIPSPVKPYKHHVPYPQRLVKLREEQKHGKFVEILKTLHINIPFLEAITSMPSYVKFMKNLLSNKGTLLENATVSLTEECSVII